MEKTLQLISLPKFRQKFSLCRKWWQLINYTSATVIFSISSKLILPVLARKEICWFFKFKSLSMTTKRMMKRFDYLWKQKKDVWKRFKWALTLWKRRWEARNQNQETPPLTIGSDIFQSLCGETLREIMSITFSSSDQEEKQLTDISTMMIINSKQY